MRVKSIATERDAIRAVLGAATRARPPPQLPTLPQLESADLTAWAGRCTAALLKWP